MFPLNYVVYKKNQRRPSLNKTTSERDFYATFYSCFPLFVHRFAHFVSRKVVLLCVMLETVKCVYAKRYIYLKAFMIKKS